MNPELLAFQQQGLSEGITTMGRSVTVNTGPSTTQVLTGVRSELTVDPGGLVVGGFSYKRAFQIRVVNASLSAVKVGQSAVDDQGNAAKIVMYKQGLTSVLYIFGSVNG